MDFILKYSDTAARHFMTLKTDPSKHRIFKDVVKALRYMESNLRHPSLNTHEYHTLKGPDGEKVFESYAQQKNARSIPNILALWPWQKYHFNISNHTPSLK